MNEPKILVIGESCKDIFVYSSTLRLAPDVPVPVLNVLYQTENPGMAKNVERNIKITHSNCDILTNPNWETITKTRYIDERSNHMFIRVDSDHSKIPRIDMFKIDWNADLIAISDYNKGFLTEEDIDYICSRHNNVFLDSKKQIGTWANDAKYIKINNYEFERSKGFLTTYLSQKLICTHGDKGCEFNGKIFPVKKVEVKDTSGAGDTFFATLVTTYLTSKGDINEAILCANADASNVVMKKGVTTI